jgi:hypothetical protein
VYVWCCVWIQGGGVRVTAVAAHVPESMVSQGSHDQWCHRPHCTLAGQGRALLLQQACMQAGQLVVKRSFIEVQDAS